MKKAKAKKRRTVGEAKKEAWAAFSDYIRLRDSIKTTGTMSSCVCITCEQTVPIKYIKGCNNSLQAGHGIGGRGKNVLFDEELVNGQCKACNMFKNGDYPKYAVVLIKKHGLEWFEEKELLSKKPAVKAWNVTDLDEIRDVYKVKVKALVERNEGLR